MINIALGAWDKALRLYTRYFPVTKGKMRLVRTFSPYVRRDGETRIARSRYGYLMKCTLNDWIQWQVYYLGDYLGEARFARYLISGSRPGETFIDIGANVGHYTLLMSRELGSDGRVYSFEPLGSTFTRLVENIDLNEATNVVASQVAIGSSTGTVNIDLVDEDNIGAARVVATTDDQSANSVESSTLDEKLRDEDLQDLRFLKMDIEGYEFEALKGAVQTLKQFKPICLIEIHREQLSIFGTTPEELFSFMSDLGYMAHHVTKRGGLVPAAPADDANLVAFIP